MHFLASTLVVFCVNGLSAGSKAAGTLVTPYSEALLSKLPSFIEDYRYPPRTEENHNGRRRHYHKKCGVKLNLYPLACKHRARRNGASGSAEQPARGRGHDQRFGLKERAASGAGAQHGRGRPG